MNLANAFSLNMLPVNSYNINIKEIEVIDAAILLSKNINSYVGHADTAIILSRIFNIDIQANRTSFTFSETNNKLLVAQYSGPRLPEGTTELPEGSGFRYFLITYL